MSKFLTISIILMLAFSVVAYSGGGVEGNVDYYILMDFKKLADKYPINSSLNIFNKIVPYMVSDDYIFVTDCDKAAGSIIDTNLQFVIDRDQLIDTLNARSLLRMKSDMHKKCIDLRAKLDNILANEYFNRSHKNGVDNKNVLLLMTDSIYTGSHEKESINVQEYTDSVLPDREKWLVIGPLDSCLQNGNIDDIMSRIKVFKPYSNSFSKLWEKIRTFIVSETVAWILFFFNLFSIVFIGSKLYNPGN